MRTKKGQILLALLLVLSVMLSACATPAPVVEVEQETDAESEMAQPADEEAVAEEVAAEEAVSEEELVEEVTAEDADLDTAVGAFLEGMEAYNTTSPTALNEALVEEEIFLLDVRETAELEESGWIEGAVNIPLREVAQNVDKLPALETPVVVYCAKGTRAALGMTALGELGYTNVKALVGGSFGGWVDAGYPVAEGTPEAAPALNEAEIDEALVLAADRYLSNLPEGWGQIDAATLNEELIESDIVLVDVRREAEVEEFGAIEGAINIPLEQFVAMKEMWPAMDANIVVYCKAGYRGNIGMGILRTYGYENVRNLKGGFTAWADADLPVSGGMANLSAQFLANMEGYNFTTPTALNEALIEEEVFLIDVRNPSELEESGYIEGAINIPVKELAQHIDLLPDFDTPIVVYCAKGTRATIGMTALGNMGFTNVKALVGNSFSGWVEEGYAVVEGLPEAEVLNAVEPNPAMLAAIDTALTNWPDGWAQVDVPTLNEELIESDIVLIDVRREEEVAENGAIEGAINLPLEKLIEMKGEWPATDANVVVYCKAGARGNIALTMMRIYGYENVRNLKGGFTAWVDAGLPVAE